MSGNWIAEFRDRLAMELPESGVFHDPIIGDVVVCIGNWMFRFYPDGMTIHQAVRHVLANYQPELLW